MTPTTAAASSERTHRFALCISGGVALGAYEAGVLSQLYRDLDRFNAHPDMQGKARVAIDAIAGSSAGSITGLILAQGIAFALPPDELEQRMRDCWVELLDIQNLLKPASESGPGDSLFTDVVVHEIVAATLTVPETAPAQSPEPIALLMTMTNLDGIPYLIDFKRTDEYHAQPGTEMYALDYRDHVGFLVSGTEIRMMDSRVLQADGTAPSSAGIWQSAIEAAKASSAFPVAFPSRYQPRNLNAYEGYKAFRKAIETDQLANKSQDPGMHPASRLPDTARFQFVDGGLFNNQPIGRAIDAVGYLNQKYPERDPDRGDRVGRSFVIIEPQPQLPEDVEQALTVSSAHPDKPTLPPTVLGKILGAYFNTALYGDFKTAAETNVQVQKMNEALAKLDALSLDPQTVADLKAEIKAAAGLDNKTQVTLQRIPHVVTGSNRLAGAFGNSFGGFLRRDFREADFITGQHEAREWFVNWLTLWLQSHADDIWKSKDQITETYAAALLGDPPPSPETYQIAPTKLTPQQLANSGWFAHPTQAGEISEDARLAALTDEERQEILHLVGGRLETLLEAWGNLPGIVVHPAAYVLMHLFGSRFIRDPHPD